MSNNALALAQSAIAALSSVKVQLASLEGRVSVSESAIARQGTPITAQGQSVTARSRYLTAGVLSSTSGQLDIDLKTGSMVVEGPAGCTVVVDLGSGDVVARIEGEQEVEPLKLVGITLYGDLASKVREVQEILSAHDVGELKVVKPSAEEGKDYIVVDGQMYINEAALRSASIRTEVSARAEADGALSTRIDGLATIQTATLDNGFKVMNGLIRNSKLGERLLSAEHFGVDDGLTNTIRQVIRDELKPGGMLHRS